MSLLAKVDVLIIDDFGAEFTEKDKEGVTWKQTKTNEIVDSRIGKSTLFTTNFTIDELAGMYGERDFSRMMENAEMLEMHGDNYRLRNFKRGITMCALCHDTGIIRKETYPGVALTEGCNCEVAKQQQEENDKRWQAWLIKFESMKQELQRNQQQKVS